MEKRIHITGDGSYTIFVPGLDEFYHSVKGAYSESMHVFINLGFKKFTDYKSINIFEVGFGTGLNCLLTFIESENQGIEIFYDALEPFPLNSNIISKLNYSSITDYPDSEKWLKSFHESGTGKWIDLDERFSLRKNIVKIEDVRLAAANYDLVYYDAFGPKAQPEMWTRDNFLKIFDSMKQNGVLVTYCSKGQVRRDLQNTGFVVERLSGPPGKREVLRAVKK